MQYLLAVFYGAVQGLTEFIPVSSSGHLVLLHQFLPLGVSDALSFDVALHFGTLLALIIYFFKDITKYLLAWVKNGSPYDRKISLLILVSMIPALIFGYFFEDFIELTLRNPQTVIVGLIVGSILFAIVEKWFMREGNFSNLTYGKSFFIGLGQSVALIPGFSRSGMSIVSGVLCGLSRENSARFAFLIAIPIIGVVALKKMIDLMSRGINSSDGIILIIGVTTSIIFGLMAIGYLLKFLKTRSLNWFGIYRLALALIIAIAII